MPAAFGDYDRDDLLGGYPAPKRFIGWQTFFDLGDGQVKNNKKIDTTISSVMFTVPTPAIAAPHTQPSPTVLPQRNLLRQLTWSLPAGQSIATAMRVTPLAAADLADIGSVYSPFATSTPLWYYMLADGRSTPSSARSLALISCSDRLQIPASPATAATPEPTSSTTQEWSSQASTDNAFEGSC